MIFANRAQAGRMLAERLRAYAKRPDVTVLGIPRGGVPVAFEIAEALGIQLDIFVARKLGVPDQEELAFGAIASGEIRVLDPEIIGAVGISDAEVEEVTARERRELEREGAARYPRTHGDPGGRRHRDRFQPTGSYCGIAPTAAGAIGCGRAGSAFGDMRATAARG
jgi:predicted phosphoribosyltransferase